MYDSQTVVLFKKNNPLSDCSPLFKNILMKTITRLKILKFYNKID